MVFENNCRTRDGHVIRDVRVLIADDQPEVRSALRLWLEQTPGFSVIGEAADLSELEKNLEGLSVDMVFLDWELPGTEGKNTMNRLRELYPQATIIVLSSLPEARKEAQEAGADLFVSKTEPPEQLLGAISTWLSHNPVHDKACQAGQ